MSSQNIDIDRFDDIFNDWDDDEDEKNDEYIDFDDPYRNIDPDEEEKQEIKTSNDPITEEKQLSQKLSQLSTSTTQQQASSTVKKRSQPIQSPLTPTALPLIETGSKKIKTGQIEAIEEGEGDPKEMAQPLQLNSEIPKYLSANNQLFEQMGRSILNKVTNNSMTIEDIRQMAFYMHQLASNHLDITLWTTYLHSGTGHLFNEGLLETISVWPTEMKLKIIADYKRRGVILHEVNHETCLNYVHKTLRQFRDEIGSYETMLADIKQRLNNNFTLEMEEMIRKFIEKYGIPLLRIPIEAQIAAVEYDYKDRLIEIEFFEQRPHQCQIDIFQNLCQSKYDKEKTKLEIAILKQRMAHHHFPTAFNTLNVTPPELLKKIEHETTRHRLTDHYEKVLQKTKSEMMLIHIVTAEAKLNEYQSKFDTYMAQYNDDQRSGPLHRKLNDAMNKIMEKRFKTINERLKYFYELKIRFFVKAPTVKN